MPYNIKIGKVKANTSNDQRYTRANRVAMVTCPICTSKSLKEMKNQGYVWVNCTSCGNSGVNEKIQDNSLMDVCDVIATLADACI